MALASAGCEMPSSSYTAGPRPQLPGLWAAELASVASTQALQRDGWRDCEAGGSGRRGWARARNRLARSASGCASGEARAGMAGRAGRAQSTAVPKLKSVRWGLLGEEERAGELMLGVSYTTEINSRGRAPRASRFFSCNHRDRQGVQGDTDRWCAAGK